MRKDKKRAKSPAKGGAQKKERLCAFGFKLKPRCGAFNLKFDLRVNPQLRQLIAQDVIPPYCYEYIDGDSVRMDQCLICHINKGIPPEEYEKIHEAHGITRANWKQVKPRLEEVMPVVAVEIKDTRKKLVEEEGLPFKMPEKRNVRDC